MERSEGGAPGFHPRKLRGPLSPSSIMPIPIMHHLRHRIALLLAFTVCPLALAHDFWVQPSTFHARIDELVKVHLHVGHAGEIDDITRNPDKIDKFIVVGPNGETNVPGSDGESPAGFIRPEKDGLYVLGFRSKHSFIELKAEEFEGYLREEGLDAIIARRKERGESDKPGKEIYSRCAKSMFIVGDDRPGEADRTLGFKLELIALKSPLSLKAGDELPLQLLLDRKPCEGVTVQLKDPRSTSEAALAKVRTDKDGKATLKLDGGGLRLVTAVYMLEAPRDNPHGAEWESLWASLSFEVPNK
jgi:uncharacterized GH25 family protein